jgi:3-isopropylmalate/(R)-2-methylmalate dehydratase small subunit
LKAWVFGDNVDTDAMAPGRYMKSGIDELARHCLESLNPAFSASVEKGDIVVAGRNFGAGSSREQAPEALRHLGVAALVAESFAGLFYRNALNLGLPALVCADAKEIHEGHVLEINFEKGEIRNLTTRKTVACEPIPPHLIQMVRDGGLLPYLEKRLRRA